MDATTWLTENGLRAAALLVLVGGIALILRRDTAMTRHRVWTMGLVGVLALPILSVSLPWHWDLLPGPTVTTVPSSSRGAEFAPPSTPVRSATDAALPSSGGRSESGTESGNATNAADAGAGPSTTWSLPPLFITLWVVGLLAVLGRLVFGLVSVRRVVRRSQPVDEARWHDLVDRCRRSLGLRTYPRLLMSDEVSVPCTAGWRRPAVILPMSASEWSAERREVVLLHELAHVRRVDIVSLLLSRLVLALHWFNPLAWLAARRIHAEAERACDELVLGTGARASEYADHLLAIVRAATARWTPVTALPMARRSDFEGRLLAILEFGRRSPRRLGRLGATAAFLAAVPVAAASRGPVVLDGQFGPGSSLTVVNTPPLEREPGTGTAPKEATPKPITPAGTNSISDPVQRPSSRENPLVATLADPVVNVRVAAAEALGSIRDTTAVLALIDVLLKDTDARVRRAAAWALGQMEDPQRSVAPLSLALKNDTSPEVRRYAAEALGNLEDRSATPALIAALTSDADPKVRREVASALSDLEDPAAVPALAGALGKESDPEIRVAVLNAIANAEDARALPQVVPMLRDADAHVRREAAHALGHMEDVRAAEPLRAALRDQDPEVRLQVIEALGNIQDRASVGALEEALKDTNAEVRREAAHTLGNLDIRVAPAGLIALVKDTDREVRRAAVHALADIEDPATVDVLIDALKDTDVEVRRSAVEGLGDIGGQAAVTALRSALRDPDPEVRRNAAQALGNISR